MSAGPARRPIRSLALVLYGGVHTPHRSCGIALAEAFGRPSGAYQALRRGGVTGQGTCGAVVAGQLLLGELLGDPDPTGKLTPALRAAMTRYLARVDAELARGRSPDLICNNLTGQHGDFAGPARHAFCTALVGHVAELVDDTLREHGVAHRPAPLRLADGRLYDPTADPPPDPPPDPAPGPALDLEPAPKTR